jgi:hypothetical protein
MLYNFVTIFFASSARSHHQTYRVPQHFNQSIFVKNETNDIMIRESGGPTQIEDPDFKLKMKEIWESDMSTEEKGELIKQMFNDYQNKKE